MDLFSKKGFPWFSLSGYLNDFEQYILEKGGKEERLQKGTYPVGHGRLRDRAFYICEGGAQLFIEHDRGRKALALFGEGALFAAGLYSDVLRYDFGLVLEVNTQMRTYSLRESVFQEMLRENGDFAFAVMDEMRELMGCLLFDMENQVFETGKSRLCDILYLCEEFGKEGGAEVHVSQSELASIAGISRVQAERILRSLRKEGVIETRREKIIIRQPEVLLSYCTMKLQNEVGEK